MSHTIDKIYKIVLKTTKNEYICMYISQQKMILLIMLQIPGN